MRAGECARTAQHSGPKIVLSAVRDDTGLLRGFVTVTRDMTDRVAKEEELRFRTAELARVCEEQSEIIDRLQRLRSQRDAEQGQLLLEGERWQIARDLHEYVEQTLFAIGLAAQATLNNPPADQSGEVAETLTRAGRARRGRRVEAPRSEFRAAPRRGGGARARTYAVESRD